MIRIFQKILSDCFAVYFSGIFPSTQSATRFQICNRPAMHPTITKLNQRFFIMVLIRTDRSDQCESISHYFNRFIPNTTSEATRRAVPSFFAGGSAAPLSFSSDRAIVAL
jgi:hypothetical protein